VLVGEVSGSELEVVSGGDLAGLDVSGNLLGKGLGLHPQPVVLVLRLGEGDHRGLGLDSLLVTDDGVRLLEGNTSVVLLEILEADLQVELTGTGNDVLSGVRDPGLDTRVGLGESLKTLDKLGKIVGVLDLDGDLDDWRDRELHDLHVVGSLGGGKGSGLEEELVDSDETDDVSGGAVLDGLNGSTHHEDGSLDGLDEEVRLGSGNVVRSLDSDLGTRSNGSREDSSEGVESTLVRGGDHLGDVKHEGTLGVAVPDTDGGLVVHGTLVEGLNSVSLGGSGRGKVEDNHLKERVSGGEELSHDGLEEGLTLEVLLLGGELNLELLEHGEDLVLLEVHDGGEDLEDRVEDEHVEGSLELLAVVSGGLGGPLLGLGVKVVVSPKSVHERLLLDTELLGVSGGELVDGEGPTVETGTESDGTLLGVNLDVTEDLVVVGGDDDVDGLDGSGERLVEVLLADLELEESSVDLVDDNDGLDSLGKSLSKDGLGLDTDTIDGVNDDESSVSDSESGGNLRREIDVTGGVDQVDEESGSVGLLLDKDKVLLGDLEEKRDGSRLDSDTSLLLIISGVHEPGVSSLGTSNDTSLGDKGVREGGLSVIDVSDNGNVSDVGGLVHNFSDLIDGEIDHCDDL